MAWSARRAWRSCRRTTRRSGFAVAALRALAPGRPLGPYARAALGDALTRGDAGDALNLLPIAIATTADPQAADSLLFLYGQEQARNKACDTASEAFNAVLERKHNRSVEDDARAGLAACDLITGQNLLAQGKPVDAEPWFSRATAPEAAADVSRMAWIGLGDVRLAQGDVPGALGSLSIGIDGGCPGRLHQRDGAKQDHRIGTGRPPAGFPSMRRLILGAALGAVAACGSPTVKTGVTPDVQFSEARRLFHQGQFDAALTAFRRLVFELPPGDASLAEARYYSAECQFQEGLLVEAAHAFRDVADQTPESPFAPLALLRAGDANLRTWRDPELDPTPGQTALAIYQELVGRYPGTEAASRAQNRVRELNDHFATKAFQNGMFYFRRHAYDSGIIYFKDVIASYPDSRLVTGALLQLAQTYAIIGYGEELKEVCGTLRRFHPAEAASARRCPPDSTTSAAH